jgi:hypothetical protein
LGRRTQAREILVLCLMQLSKVVATLLACRGPGASPRKLQTVSQHNGNRRRESCARSPPRRQYVRLGAVVWCSRCVTFGRRVPSSSRRIIFWRRGLDQIAKLVRAERGWLGHIAVCRLVHLCTLSRLNITFCAIQRPSREVLRGTSLSRSAPITMLTEIPVTADRVQTDHSRFYVTGVAAITQATM